MYDLPDAPQGHQPCPIAACDPESATPDRWIREINLGVGKFWLTWLWNLYALQLYDRMKTVLKRDEKVEKWHLMAYFFHVKRNSQFLEALNESLCCSRCIQFTRLMGLWYLEIAKRIIEILMHTYLSGQVGTVCTHW